MPELTRDEIVRLTAPERLELIGSLWDSLDDAELPLPPAQLRELEQRLFNVDQDLPRAMTWEELKVELAARSR
jgi:putative addiction module component (TIGR02574 family)